MLIYYTVSNWKGRAAIVREYLYDIINLPRSNASIRNVALKAIKVLEDNLQ